MTARGERTIRRWVGWKLFLAALSAVLALTLPAPLGVRLVLAAVAVLQLGMVALGRTGLRRYRDTQH